MCVICTLFEQEKLTAREASRALFERINTEALTEEERRHLVDELIPKILRASGYDFSKLYPIQTVEDEEDLVVEKGKE